jgi:hypothetical protein
MDYEKLKEARNRLKAGEYKKVCDEDEKLFFANMGIDKVLDGTFGRITNEIIMRHLNLAYENDDIFEKVIIQETATQFLKRKLEVFLAHAGR